MSDDRSIRIAVPSLTPRRLLAGVELLVDAYEYAADLAVRPDEFAVARADLFDRGVTNVDLLWLSRKGFVSGADGGVALTAAGLAVCRDLLARPPAPPPAGPAIPPEWDGLRRELRWVGRVVKRFRVPAPNQEVVLATFQEEAWPPHIDDPLPGAVGVEPKRRLHDTIVALNRHQYQPGLRFVGDGTGLGVRWQAAG